MSSIDARSALHWPAHATLVPAARPAPRPNPRQALRQGVRIARPTAAPAPAMALDPLAQMARDDQDDWVLLRLVVCVAVATMALAAASTLIV